MDYTSYKVYNLFYINSKRLVKMKNQDGHLDIEQDWWLEHGSGSGYDQGHGAIRRLEHDWD